MRVHPSDSLSLQSGKSPLQRPSPAGSSRADLLCKFHRSISERPVTPRVESTKPHSLSERLSQPLLPTTFAPCLLIPILPQTLQPRSKFSIPTLSRRGPYRTLDLSEEEAARCEKLRVPIRKLVEKISDYMPEPWRAFGTYIIANSANTPAVNSVRLSRDLCPVLLRGGEDSVPKPFGFGISTFTVCRCNSLWQSCGAIS